MHRETPVWISSNTTVVEMKQAAITLQRTALCLVIISTFSVVAFAKNSKAITGAPTSQSATSGKNGISVNASDNAKVIVQKIYQTIYMTDPALSKALAMEQAKREQAEQEAGKLTRERDTLASELELAKTYLRIAQDASKQDAGETVKKARQALLVGDVKEAERLLQVDEEQFAAVATRNLRKAAQLARERASLAEGQDTAKALSALRKAAEYEPGNRENWWRLGDILITSGNLADAVKAYERFQALVMDEVRRDPGNSEWQRDLSVSYERIGDVQVAQGDLAGALKSYTDGLNIARQLAGRDPLNAQWATDVVVSLYNLASLAPKGLSSEKAVASLREALDILEKLDKQAKLTHQQQSWLPMVTQRLNELEKSTGKE